MTVIIIIIIMLTSAAIPTNKSTRNSKNPVVLNAVASFPIFGFVWFGG